MSADAVYVADAESNAVLVYDSSGRETGRLNLPAPSAVAVAADGRIYAGSYRDRAVYVLDRTGHRLGFLGEGKGSFRLPRNITVDNRSGEVYVVDQLDGAIKVFSAAGAYLRRLDESANLPQDLAIVGDELFVIDQPLIADGQGGMIRGGRVQVFSKDGAPRRVFGASGEGKLARPKGIAAGPDGRIYIADAFHGAVFSFSQEGAFLGAIRDRKVAAVSPFGVGVSGGRLYVASPMLPGVESFLVGYSPVGDNCPGVNNPDQADRDGDGAGDACDGCPDNAAKTSAGVCGCQVADVDSDHDGLMACLDQNDRDPLITTGQPVATTAAPEASPAATPAAAIRQALAGGAASPASQQLLSSHQPVVGPDGVVVFLASAGGSWLIMAHDPSTNLTTQLAPALIDSREPVIDAGNQIYFAGSDGADYDIYRFDYESYRQHGSPALTDPYLANLTDRINPRDDRAPRVNSRGDLVWQGFDGSDDEIFFRDGETGKSKVITANDRPDAAPWIAVDREVFWLADGNSHHELRMANANQPDLPATVVWDASEVESLVVNGNGAAAFTAFDGHDFEIYAYNAATGLIALTNNETDDFAPAVNVHGDIAWSGFDGHDYEIYLYDGRLRMAGGAATILQLSNNDGDDLGPKLTSNRDVIWYGGDGGIFEIHMFDGIGGVLLPPLTEKGDHNFLPAINTARDQAWMSLGGSGLDLVVSQGDRWRDPDGNGSSCNDCHGNPPASGSHESHVNRGITCVTCHSATTADGATISNVLRHDNGVYDVLPAGDFFDGSGWRRLWFEYQRTSGFCASNNCHASQGKGDAAWQR